LVGCKILFIAKVSEYSSSPDIDACHDEVSKKLILCGAKEQAIEYQVHLLFDGRAGGYIQEK
jgi:hypothetical protein